MAETHVPTARVDVPRGERRSSRRKLVGAAAAGALAVSGLRLAKAQPVGDQKLGIQREETFSNGNPITIVDNSNAQPYGSHIAVSGMPGSIQTLRVTLDGISHQLPEQIEVMLVSPTGIGKVIMAGCGGTNAISNAELKIQDEAANLLPDTATIVSGNYKPTNHLEAPPSPGTSFGAPAPEPVLGEDFTVFLGLAGNALNGRWTLYVKDNDSPVAGSIANGWKLRITTENQKPKAKNDTYDVRAGKTFRDRKPGVLRNDVDEDNDKLKVKPLKKESRLGKLRIRKNGTLIFKAEEDVSGSVSYTYRIEDPDGEKSKAKVKINVKR